jgi:hypothetical protein
MMTDFPIFTFPPICCLGSGCGAAEKPPCDWTAGPVEVGPLVGFTASSRFHMIKSSAPKGFLAAARV